MRFWAGLYAVLDREALEEGANTMLRIAIDLLNKKPRREDRHLLQDVDDDHQE
jgi:hypothetical protein